MKIDGKAIAQQILEDLKQEIKKRHLSPTLQVLLVGDNPASLSYIKQKQKAADFIGAKIINQFLPEKTSSQNLIKLIGDSNKNPRINGIIVQLPLPKHFNSSQISTLIDPRKDIDGFTPNSPFTPPVAAAVLKVLASIPGINISKYITVIGRGITAGKPIAETLVKNGYQVEVAHSKTRSDQLSELLKSADIVISCVGRPDVFQAKDLKPGAIVIGVGLHRTPEGKLAGDFKEEEIGRVASYYTPTPGGIGPINVACLMENLVEATC